MKVIFVESVGDHKVGAVLEVKDGYARNYLLPQKLAVIASAANLEQSRAKIEEAQHRHEELSKLLNETKHKLEATELVFERKSEQGDKLFGAVTNLDVWEALSEQGYSVEKHDIELTDIKKTGQYSATVKLSPEITATVKLKVVAESD